MCPDKKLKWFKDHGHSAAQIREIKKMVTNRGVKVRFGSVQRPFLLNSELNFWFSSSSGPHFPEP